MCQEFWEVVGARGKDAGAICREVTEAVEEGVWKYPVQVSLLNVVWGVMHRSGGRRRRMSKKEKLSMVLDVVKMNNVRTVKIPLNWAKDG